MNYFRIAKSNSCNPVFLLFLIASFTFLSCYFPMALNAEESSCVSCHTDAKKLIEITRAIEAVKLAAGCKPAVESEGEG